MWNAPFFFVQTVKMLLWPWILLLHGIHTRVLAKFYQSISKSWSWCTLLRNASAESDHGGVYPFNQPGPKVNPPKIFGAYQGLMTHPFSGWSPFGVESQWYPLLFPEVRRCPAFVSATFDVQTWWWDARSNFAAFEREKCARAWVKVNCVGHCWTHGGFRYYAMSHCILTWLRPRVMKCREGFRWLLYRSSKLRKTPRKIKNTWIGGVIPHFFHPQWP